MSLSLIILFLNDLNHNLKQYASVCHEIVVLSLNQINTFYTWINSFADPRVEHWLFMSTPLPTLSILICYLLMIHFGPKWMSNKPAFELRNVMLIYNFGISILNAWIAGELLYCGLKRKYNFMCQLVDFSDNQHEIRIAVAIWWYYASKGIEFADSLFFILRKRTHQLSFLHVYHHSTMFAFWWVGAKFVPGGTALSAAMVNCFVHVLMYTYYGLTASQCHSLLGWKRYLTILQLIQFSTGVILGIRAIVTQCQFTRWMQYFFVCYAFSFILLFGQFYKNTYGGGPGLQSKSILNLSDSRSKAEVESFDFGHTEKKPKISKQSKSTKLKSN